MLFYTKIFLSNPSSEAYLTPCEHFFNTQHTVFLQQNGVL